MTKRINLPKQNTPLKVIRMMCIECMGGDNAQACRELIKDCPAPACPLHEFRFGRNPYSKRRGNIKNFVLEVPERAGAREKLGEIVG